MRRIQKSLIRDVTFVKFEKLVEIHQYTPLIKINPDINLVVSPVIWMVIKC